MAITVLAVGEMILLADWRHFVLGPLLFLMAIFLILLVLVQRGRGGGLTGALGGMGGQSAFGTKAGDTFTRVTYGTAIIWIALCIVTIKVLAPPPPKATTQGNTVTGREIPAKDQRESGTTGPTKTGAESGGTVPEPSNKVEDTSTGGSAKPAATDSPIGASATEKKEPSAAESGEKKPDADDSSDRSGDDS